MPIVDASGPLPDAGDSAVYKDKSQSTVLTVRRDDALSPFDLVLPADLLWPHIPGAAANLI